jgi:hypothetical protein
VIIDQAFRNVYKGSEIMSLAELAGINHEERRNTEQREKEQQVWRGDGWREEEDFEKANRDSSGGGELIRAMDQMMAGVERYFEDDIKLINKVNRRGKRKILFK